MLSWSLGNNLSNIAEKLLHYNVDKVFVYDDEELAYFNIEKYTNVFEDFIKNTTNEKMIDAKNKANKIKHNTPRIRKLIPKDSIVYKKKLETIEERFVGKYTAILERNSDDASVADILYIKDRRKKIDDFDMIFNEILLIRESINKPLKRDLNEYYKDRYSLFLQAWI